MNFARVSTRLGFIAAGMCLAISAVVIAGGSGSWLQAQDGKDAKEAKPDVEERQKPVGRVIKIDGQTKQLTLDIDVPKGAETGKRYMVIREVKADGGEDDAYRSSDNVHSRQDRCDVLTSHPEAKSA